MSGERAMVIGVAIGYGERQIGPFVTSLRRTGYAGRIVLIVDDATVAAVAGVPGLGDVELLRVPSRPLNVKPIFGTRVGLRLLWPPYVATQWAIVRLAGLLPGRDRAGRRRRVAASTLHPQLARFFHYRRILQDADVEQVLISDVRDVVFQADPFACLDGTDLAVGLETSRYTIATEYWNRMWVRTGFGRAMLDRVGDERVSCAGVILGERTTLIRYVDLVVEEILRWPVRGMINKADQGVHNVLLWTGRLGQPALLEPMDSPLLTLNGMTVEDLRFGEDGRLTNADGSPISIVHQFDRLAGLPERLTSALRLDAAA